MELSHFVTYLTSTSVRMPRMMWDDEEGEKLTFDGHTLTRTAFANMYQHLLQITKDKLYGKVCLNIKLPNIHSAEKFDVLSNTEPNYSTFTREVLDGVYGNGVMLPGIPAMTTLLINPLFQGPILS